MSVVSSLCNPPPRKEIDQDEDEDQMLEEMFLMTQRLTFKVDAQVDAIGK